jgi:hypothetical protein
VTQKHHGSLFSGWFAGLSYPEPGLRENHAAHTTFLGGPGKNALVRAM